MVQASMWVHLAAPTVAHMVARMAKACLLVAKVVVAWYYYVVVAVGTSVKEAPTTAHLLLRALMAEVSPAVHVVVPHSVTAAEAHPMAQMVACMVAKMVVTRAKASMVMIPHTAVAQMRAPLAGGGATVAQMGMRKAEAVIVTAARVMTP